jgi:hypothetical protein
MRVSFGLEFGHREDSGTVADLGTDRGKLKP